MNVLFVVLILLAVLIGLINLGLLFMWLKGIGSLAFPAVRFIIGIPMMIVFSSIFQLAIVILAAIVERYRSNPNGILIRSL